MSYEDRRKGTVEVTKQKSLQKDIICAAGGNLVKQQRTKQGLSCKLRNQKGAAAYSQHSWSCQIKGSPIKRWKSMTCMIPKEMHMEII